MTRGYILSPLGANIVRRGGDDSQDDDGMVILELMKRAPGLSKEDLQKCFVALRMEYGPDALHALRSGHVVFEEVRAGTRTKGEAS